MIRITVSFVVLAAVGVAAQSGAPHGQWPTYGGDLGSTRYSALDQINAANFKTLEIAWRFRTDNLGPRPEFFLEATPLVVNGVLYSTGGTRRAVFALDAGTGEQLWLHSEREGARGTNAPRQLSGRGLAYWAEGNDERILYVTPGYRLIALNAKTGVPITGFGGNGVVDLKLDDDQDIDLVTGEVGLHSTPIVAGDIVIVGAAHRAGGVPRTRRNVKGYVRGFDVRTGKRLWIFHTIPLVGEFGHDTWENESWVYTGNTGVWAQMSVDEQLGLAYLPVELPTGDYYGGHRPGSGLFGESLVAVDLKTGRRRWHYQFVHHGIWDMDIPCAPILADITVNGRTLKAVAQPTKQNYLYVFNRETGEPIWPIEERPVPKGDVPGEWYSPTQPFPVKPPALTRVDFVKERDMVRPEDTSAEHVKACEDLWDKSGGFYSAGPFTPFMFHEDGAPPKSTIQFPGGTGGVNWGGPAADPGTGYVFVNAHDTSLVGWIEKVRPGQNYGRGTEGSKQPYDRGSVNGAGPYFTFSAPMRDENGKVIANLPCQRPPWARLVAVNANTGDIAWQVPLGITDALPEGRKNTGGSGSAGPIATAGGIVIVGATNDRRIRAFDSKNGKELWVAQLPGQGNANPITYTGKNGKQYVAIIATDSLQVFSLP